MIEEDIAAAKCIYSAIKLEGPWCFCVEDATMPHTRGREWASCTARDCSATLIVAPPILSVLIDEFKIIPLPGNNNLLPSNFNPTIIQLGCHTFVVQLRNWFLVLNSEQPTPRIFSILRITYLSKIFNACVVLSALTNNW